MVFTEICTTLFYWDSKQLDYKQNFLQRRKEARYPSSGTIALKYLQIAVRHRLIMMRLTTPNLFSHWRVSV